MRTLIVHDRTAVSDEIAALVSSISVEHCIISRANDETSARRVLRDHIFDLLIIDLTLPHIFGRDQPSYASADRLLRELFELDDMNVPGDIIGLTQDTDALERVSNSINPHVMAVIHEDREGRWKSSLSDKITYASRAAKTRQLSINSHYDYDSVIITALDKELSPYHDLFETETYSRYPGCYAFSYIDNREIPRRGMMFAIGKSGPARAASYTQSLISLFRPRVVMMSGICGGVGTKVKLGDLVVADSAIDWDYGKWADNEPSGESTTEATPPVFHFRPGPVSIADTAAHRVARELIASDLLRNPEFTRRVAQVSEGRINSPEAHLAPMASGSAVIASDDILHQIWGLNEPIRGIDMESFGFYHAATKTHVVRPECLCIKSVSDFSNGTKGDEFHVGCSYVSAAVTSYILRTLWPY